MAIILTLLAGLALGFIVGFWFSLGEIHALEERVAYEEGRNLARDLEATIDDLETGKGDWAWPGRGY